MPTCQAESNVQCTVTARVKEQSACLSYFFAIASHLTLKMLLSSLNFSVTLILFLALSYTLAVNWTVMLLQPLHTHLADV